MTELWIALGEGPAFEDFASGSGQYPEQARRIGCGSAGAQRADSRRPRRRCETQSVRSSEFFAEIVA